MSGRVEKFAGRQHAVRQLAGTACVLVMTALIGLGAAQAQDMSGVASAMEPAGNGTGDAVAAFDPTAAGMHLTGEAASPLASYGEAPAPFDINSTRRPKAPSSPVLAMHQPVVSEPVAATPMATPAAPAVGQGAPSTGSSTPGTAPSATTPGTTTPAAASTDALPPAISPVQARIAELVATHLPRFSPRQSERDALANFYAVRQYQPVFISGNTLSPLGRTVLQQFASSGQDGLAPADYEMPPLSARPSDTELAEAELRLAATTMLYARHVQSGRFDPARISENVDPNPTVPEPAAILSLVTTAPNPHAVLNSFAPQYDEYRLLKVQLAALHGTAPVTTAAPIPSGPIMRPGMEDRRVPLLRARLGVGGDPDNYVYDNFLRDAVREFQQMSGQKPDGAVGSSTIAALNGVSGGDKVADILANMERWRWVPHEVAPAYVIVNIPEYMVRVVRNEQTVHETRVVVGKPENQTPIMSHDMEYFVFNPSWNLPPGIMRNEMLPKLVNDPYALDRQGIDVVRNGRIIDPGTVDWRRGTQGYSFRQPPGERNALGRMKFMFPNKHSVYLHDTPSRSLFARDRRAFSHGCVRVNEPMKFAEAIFQLGMPNDAWPESRISKLLGGNEKYVNLKQRFPVHLVYFTSYVDGQGQLVSREDIYGVNAATKAILGLDGTRRVAEQSAPMQRR